MAFSHHAYLYEGSLELLEELADHAAELFAFETEHNPDVFVRGWEKFGIDESRALTETASLRPTSGRALYVIGITSITSEAQQALLKLLEEPQPGVVFVLLVPHGTVLPTLRSRMLLYPHALKEGAVGSQTRDFLASSYKKRSEWITAFLKDEDGARERVRTFMNELERALHPRIEEKDVREGLQDIADLREYLADRAPSLKMILEHLAATLPQIK